MVNYPVQLYGSFCILFLNNNGVMALRNKTQQRQTVFNPKNQVMTFKEFSVDLRDEIRYKTISKAWSVSRSSVTLIIGKGQKF